MKFKNKIPFLGILLAFSISGCSSAAPSSESLAPSSQTPPSSEVPSSELPSSEVPTSEIPSSELPSSEVPSSEVPSSEDISSEEPSSELPESSSELAPGELPDLGEPAVAFHYHRDDGDYAKWNLWLWEQGADGKAYEFNYTDDYGVVGFYPLSTWKNVPTNSLGFIVRTASWDKDPGDDRYVYFNETTADNKQTYHYYLYTSDATIYTDPSVPLAGIMKDARFSTPTRIYLEASKPIQSVKIYEGEESIVDSTYTNPKKTQFVDLENNVDFSKEYRYQVTLTSEKVIDGDIDISALYSSDLFNETYAYDGELGAIYTKESTTFRVWSPFSSEISLVLYDTGTPAKLGGSDTPVTEIPMTKGEKGTFEVTVDDDLEGAYYTYKVTNKTYSEKEIVDPYAKSAGVNGLRGMVVDFSKTNPAGWDNVYNLGYDRKVLTVYETHVADVTSSDTWGGDENNAKLFKGMYETDTTYTEGDVTVKTGFDHIKELGVNAVQILPLFDQDNDEINVEFNWGYNPLNYNVVEGCYSSDPKDGYVRIREFKELVQAYNRAGIEIIMDVVYNHVSSAIGSNFDVLFPGYYYRYVNGNLSNGSGCGNETASENYMFRKFMIDSTEFWLKEYKLDGFRFDLMGLHDIETMNQLVANAKTINPDVVIYGEPWTGGSTPLPESKQAIQKNASKFEGYGQFNDQVRNALHGGVFDDTLTKLGWCDAIGASTKGTVSTIGIALFGTTQGGTTDPNKTVNYVTCHDNRTLFDRIVATGRFDVEKQYDEIVDMCGAAQSIVFLSNGTSFMLAGEEFARTKGGDHNSYQSGYKVNELDYSLKIKNYRLFEKMQILINIKQTFNFLHLEEDQLVYTVPIGSEAVQNCWYSYDNKYSSIMMKIVLGDVTYIVIHNNGIKLTTPVSYNLEGYTLVYDSLDEGKELTSNTVTGRCETLVAYLDASN